MMFLDDSDLGLSLNLRWNERADGKKLALSTTVIALATLLITLSPVVKTLTLDCPGLLTTDTISVQGLSLPLLYELRSWRCQQNGKITVDVFCPILTVGGVPLIFNLKSYR